MEPCKRIDENPAVLIGRIGHQTQFLDSGTDRPGSKTLYRGEVDDELFDKLPLQLFERNVLTWYSYSRKAARRLRRRQ